MVEKTLKNNNDITIANFSYRKGTVEYKNSNIGDYLFGHEGNYTIQNKADMFFTNGSPMASVCNKLYSRSFLRNINVKFEDGVLAEDRLFNLKCFVNSPIILVVNEYTYKCNIVENSRSRSVNNEYFEEIISLFHNFYNYLKQYADIKQHTDLIQFTLITDTEKILNYIYINSNRKVLEIRRAVLLVKNDRVVLALDELSNGHNVLTKIKGRKNNLKRLNLQNKIFINCPAIVFSMYYVMYRKLIYVKSKTK